ncbi:hypothetical protein BZA05DRAFT_442717 [Tricharina praecox]|uniref:uncharacterized protein n=1 Tax=Tricharina praecox TaxID=43433 RepID=UPI0022211FEE|nr:uncharacterized protein BZA05DRAFT_442717 [Tricharina praecox]KAI5856052.1 hypothetical protein BZA05DRAFT_442717 [Tricharina praecox]
MRGAAFPVGLAILFGVMNGVYIFKPMLIEARLARLQEAGEDVNAIGTEKRKEEEVKLHNAKARIEAAEGRGKEEEKKA